MLQSKTATHNSPTQKEQIISFYHAAFSYFPFPSNTHACRSLQKPLLNGAVLIPHYNTLALRIVPHKTSSSQPGRAQDASPCTLCTKRSLLSAATPTCVEVRVRVFIHLLVLQDIVRHLRPNGRLHIQPLQRDHGAGGLHVGGEPQAGQETGKKPNKTSAPFLGRNPHLQAAQPQAGLTFIHRDVHTDPQGQGAQGEHG